ncbi:MULTISPECIES: lipoxygenase family protein [Pseudanabaena]|uniref:lipoxygenase family protein n=1 Tax=Pseudanabaena TaxID=1152 RepID=UPI00247B2541|nr:MULTISPECIES: lipoxygenase family protein [Pseudanabaena]MEA5487751.1 lipoxygenase family protein [Pseudanabaena sp. CCNP1317]WGS72511.1 lipoxygenase family protein [Pseudanabaena galeata CCNP1313]
MIFSLLNGVARILNFLSAKLADLANLISRRSKSSKYPLLPQNDPEISQRQASLNQARQLYQYNYTYIDSLPMVEKVPTNERFSLSWGLLVGKVVVRVLLNDRANPLLLEKSKDVCKVKQLDFSKRLLAASMAHSDSAIVELLSEIPTFLETEPTNIEGSNIKEYNNLFWVISLPAISQNFTSNSEFARLRVAGFNPLMIQQVKTLDAKFPLTEEQFKTVLADDSLAEAGSSGRLYLADYAELTAIAGGTFPKGEQKYINAPLALFAVPKGKNSLTPIAIQLGQDPNTNPIFLRQAGDEPNWLLAKTVVQIADANYHQLISHLGRTHLFIEPFAIATNRQLASNHPLYILLKPHFQGTLAINDAAQSGLVSAGGTVDSLLAGSIATSRAVSVRGVKTYNFDEAMLPVALKKRGVDDPNLLPDYPYRDDALLVWEAIATWVKNYLSIYYFKDDDVIRDSELQAWVQEIISDNGGRVTSFGQGGQIRTIDYLVSAVTMLIFTASAQHAAVNFPQSDLMTYAPAIPLASYAPAPTTTTGAKEADFFAMLPPIDQAKSQLTMTYILGSVYYTTLGEYGTDYFSDDRIQQPLRDFQDQLKAIESTIKSRNEQRVADYNYLRPSRIPQSINI